MVGAYLDPATTSGIEFPVVHAHAICEGDPLVSVVDPLGMVASSRYEGDILGVCEGSEAV